MSVKPARAVGSTRSLSAGTAPHGCCCCWPPSIVVADDRIGCRAATVPGLKASSRPPARTGRDAHAGLRIDADQLDAGRHAERHRRLVGERHLEEVPDDRRRRCRRPSRRGRSGAACRSRGRRRPRGRARSRRTTRPFRRWWCRSCRRSACRPRADRSCAVPRWHHAFHHRGDLVGGHRVDAPARAVSTIDGSVLVRPALGVAAAAFALVVLEDGVAVAVLDAVDQRRLDALAAVGEHRIGR